MRQALPVLSQDFRPVYSSKIDVTGISLSKTSLTLVGRNTTETLTATVIPSDASEKHVVWFSENPEVATVSADGIITAVWAGTANITAIIDQNKRATCVVTVIDPTLGSSGGHDWVDMGNGLKWATMNVGATQKPAMATFMPGEKLFQRRSILQTPISVIMRFLHCPNFTMQPRVTGVAVGICLHCKTGNG